jgi:hypothetical protein
MHHDIWQAADFDRDPQMSSLQFLYRQVLEINERWLMGVEAVRYGSACLDHRRTLQPGQ